jgi:hypothetical protein
LFQLPNRKFPEEESEKYQVVATKNIIAKHAHTNKIA